MSEEFKDLLQRVRVAEDQIENLNMRAFVAERETRCVEKRLQDRIGLVAGAAGYELDFPVRHVKVPIAEGILAPLQRAIQHYLNAREDTLRVESRDDLVKLHALINTLDLVKDRRTRGY